MVSWITREEIDIIVAKAVAAERERWKRVVRDAIEALERDSTSAPVLEILRAAIRKGE